MSSGSSIRIFVKGTKGISASLYEKYLNGIRKFNDVIISTSSCICMKEPVYPNVLSVRNDENKSVWIWNFLNSMFSKPTKANLGVANCIGEFDFCSDFKVLLDYWGLNPYIPEKTQKIISDTEVSQLRAALNYILSNVRNLNNSRTIEELVFDENPFFNDLSHLLPQNSNKDDTLVYFRWCYKDLSTILNYYSLLKDRNSENINADDLRLVYFAW